MFGSAICKLLYRDGLLGNRFELEHSLDDAMDGGSVTDVISALSCVQGNVADGGSRRAQPNYETGQGASPMIFFAAGWQQAGSRLAWACSKHWTRMFFLVAY